jgi:hypothetical protein
MRLAGKFAPLFLGMLLCSCGDTGSRQDGGIVLCDTDDDCQMGQYCHDGICTEVRDGGECTRDLDCSPGEVCTNGTCVPGQADGGDGDAGDLGPLLADIEADP